MKSQEIAYSYIRFSSLPQQYGDSIRRQKQMSAEMAKRHGWKLDETLRIDKGRSAWTGENATLGYLAAFLKLCEGTNRKVKPGSILIVESLDRLSREKAPEALALFSRIINAGIKIAVASKDKIYSKEAINSNQFLLFEVLMDFILANEESEKKSFRGKECWKEKRRSDTILTNRVPNWMRVVNGKITLIPERAKTVNYIFDLTISGLGYLAIARRLNAEGVPCFYGKFWQQSSVGSLLHNRAVIGEFQPESRHATNIPPKPNYYPAAVSLEKWHKVQVILKTRKNGMKGKNGQCLNLFKGIIRDARTGESLVLVTKSSRGSYQTHLVSNSAINGNGNYISFPYRHFEEAFRGFVSELQAAELWDEVTREESIQEKTDALNGEIEHQTANIERIKDRIKTGELSDELLDLVVQLENARKNMIERRKDLEEQKEHKPAKSLKEVKSMLLKPLDTPEKREQMRNKIRQIVESIWVKVDATGRFSRRAMVQVFFVAGGWRLIQIDTNTKSGKHAWGSVKGTGVIDLRKNPNAMDIYRIDNLTLLK
jgi:DNA invertase Pin-like site-specific DNA recombinase/gas vesicle protein